MLTDFTFKNELILNYFKGDNSYLPVSELIYLHEHPLIKQSFLIDMERLINETSEYLVKKNVQGFIVNKFINHTIKLGAELPVVNQQSAPKVLEELRNVYKLCKSLLN